MENNQLNDDWISVSEMAKRLGCTKQTCYNHLKQNKYEYKTFSRGSMRGLLVKFPQKTE